MNKKLLILIILIALVGLGLGGWLLLRGNDQSVTYTTAVVERGAIVSTISASGNLVQSGSFSVTSGATGFVKKVLVSDGDQVAVGQALVEVELDQDGQEARSKAWSAYLAAKSSFDSAVMNETSLAKGVNDAKSKLISAQSDFDADWGSTEYWDSERRKRWLDLQSAEASLRLAEQKYAQADEAITKAQIDLDAALLAYQRAAPVATSPSAGSIADISVVSGLVLSAADQKLLSVVDDEYRPLLSVSVSEIDIGLLAVGQKATVTFDALADRTFTGRVAAVDRSGTATQGVVSYPILIQLDAGVDQIYPNMSATAEIITEAKESVLWVPPQAIRTQSGRTVVRVSADGAVEERPVEVGLETSDRAEILSGLAEGEAVVVSEQTASDEAATFGSQGGMRMIMGGAGR